MKQSHLTVLVCATVFASACGGNDDEAAMLTYRAGFGDTGVAQAAPAVADARPPASAPASTTVPAPTSDPVPVVVQVTVPVTTAAEPADDGLNPLGGNSPEDRLMPSVVCMDLQEAQDEIQDHGVFFSRSEDATGEGRRQIWDRNWQVVAQTPESGEPIGEGDAVLYVVKDDDDYPNPC